MDVPVLILVYFFFQAEDGIRDSSVTGVQTCALPIFSVLFWCWPPGPPARKLSHLTSAAARSGTWCGSGRSTMPTNQIGRASCRERGEVAGGGGGGKKNEQEEGAGGATDCARGGGSRQ